jgi:hypothetical protein
LGGRALALVALLTALSVCLTACGSDGGRLSAHEFTRRATRSCAWADRHASALLIPPIDDHRSVRALTRLVDIERHALNELQDLRPPKHLTARVDEWLATIDQLVVEAEFLRHSLRHRDHRVAEAVAVRAARLALRAQVLAGALGVRGCTMPTPPPVDPSDE